MDDPEEIIYLWPAILKTRFVERYGKTEMLSAIGGVLMRTFFCVKLFKDQKLTGIIVAQTVQSPPARAMFLIVQVCLFEGISKEFRDPFYSWLKENGYNVLGGRSTMKDEAIMRLFDVEKIFTYFEKEF